MEENRLWGSVVGKLIKHMWYENKKRNTGSRNEHKDGIEGKRGGREEQGRVARMIQK